MRHLFFYLAVFSGLSLQAQLQFSDVAVSVGANYNYGPASTFGAGVSFADFNGDGWDDLTLTTDENQEIHFLRNDGGTFTKVSLTGINLVTRTKQVVWVDYDNDGDKDLFVTSVSGLNKLYNNNGSLVFTDVTVAAGLFTTDLNTYGSTFGDIDNDGDLDLFVCNREGDDNRNYLYRNNNGVFEDITTSAGINTDVELTFDATFFDYDNDGDQDLYIINDKSDANRLYQNNGSGSFTDVSITSGAGITIDAMSITIGDYNNDGWFDIYITNIPNGNQLLKNNGDGTFSNVAASAGVSFDSFSWGASFLDADMDGFEDLYVSGSFDDSIPSFLPSAFYHNNGNDTFTIPSNIGFANDIRMSFGNAIGDFNNDGKPDIVVMNENFRYFLWENQTTTNNNWIKIKLEGVTSNKDGVGNKIEVRANNKSYYRYTAMGEGYLGQHATSEFVGIGAATDIDYVKVTWNRTGVVETINNVTPNTSITIQEGNGILSLSGLELLKTQVFPNPSKTGVFQLVTAQNKDVFVQVFDAFGRLVLPRQRANTTLDISKLSKGLYFAKIYTANSAKLVKMLYR